MLKTTVVTLSQSALSHVTPPVSGMTVHTYSVAVDYSLFVASAVVLNASRG